MYSTVVYIYIYVYISYSHILVLITRLLIHQAIHINKVYIPSTTVCNYSYSGVPV